MLVSNLDPNYPPDITGGWSRPEPGFHLVRMMVTVIDQAGEGSASSSQFELKDALGYKQFSDSSYGPDCQTAAATDMAPGGSWGPTPLCFEAGGDPTAPITLVWAPTFEGTQVQIPLQSPPTSAATATAGVLATPTPVPESSPTPAISPTTGGPLNVAVIGAVRAKHTENLRVFVTDQTHHPMAKVSVTLYALGAGIKRVYAGLTQASGEVDFTHLRSTRAGSIYLLAWKPGLPSTAITLLAR